MKNTTDMSPSPQQAHRDHILDNGGSINWDMAYLGRRVCVCGYEETAPQRWFGEDEPAGSLEHHIDNLNDEEIAHHLALKAAGAVERIEQSISFKGWRIPGSVGT